jgi:translation initiation factor 1
VTCAACEKPLAQCACPRGVSGSIARPHDQAARVGREKRRGGKVVTIVSGLDAAATDLPELLRKLKAACAAGGTVSEGKIEVQGDQRDRVVAMLRELGYPAKLAGG